MGFFDYAVPEGMEIARGDLIGITLRGRPMLGIAVSSPIEATDHRLKPVTGVHTPGYLADPLLAFYESLAADLIQSPASVLEAAIPTPPKRATTTLPAFAALPLSLPADEAPAARRVAEQLIAHTRAFVLAPDLRRTAALVAAYLDVHPKTRLILVAPNVRDAQLLQSRLGRFAPTLITGGETNNARFRAWQAARIGETRLLIGTRLAVLLPFVEVTTIWVARAGHDNHKNSDQNPRYDAREAAELAAKTFGAQLILSDVSVRAEEIARIPTAAFFDPFPRASLVYADPGKERSKHFHPLLGPTILTQIEDTLARGRRAVCVYNRLGDAGGLRCADCAHSFPCPACGRARIHETEHLRCRLCKTREPLPKSCPVCFGYAVTSRGFGNRTVADALRLVFPKATVGIIDKETGEAEANADIVVATQHYLEQVFDPFDPPSVGVVALLDADTPLRRPDFRAEERAFRDAAEWRGLAHACRANLIIQSNAPSLFEAALGDPLHAAEEEQKKRADYDESPARRRIHIVCKQTPAETARLAAETLIQQLSASIPDILCALGPSEPGTYLVVARIKPEFFKEICAILAGLDDAYLIDTSPILW